MGLFDVVDECRSRGGALITATELWAGRMTSREGQDTAVLYSDRTNSWALTVFSNWYRMLFSDVNRPEREDKH